MTTSMSPAVPRVRIGALVSRDLADSSAAFCAGLGVSRSALIGALLDDMMEGRQGQWAVVVDDALRRTHESARRSGERPHNDPRNDNNDSNAVS